VIGETIFLMNGSQVYAIGTAIEGLPFGKTLVETVDGNYVVHSVELFDGKYYTTSYRRARESQD
jgi:hypothetical protein